jgi:anaerobic magnesium-protoporphyrin IX monomethyl ester cyclase
MIGIPTETVADFKDTIGLTRECKPDQFQLSIFCPYPGTDLYQYCLENKIITGPIKDLGREVACMDLPGFPRRQIQQQYDSFTVNVFADNIVRYLAINLRMFFLYRWKRLFPFSLIFKKAG